MKLKVVFLALIICCVLPQIYSLAFRKEIFPWSSFPMYSGKDVGTDLFLLSAYVVDEKGQELPLERTGILRPKYEYRSRLNPENAWNRPLTEAENAVLKRFAEIFNDDFKARKISYNQLRYYLEYWNKFTGPQRYNPDERRLILEYPLQP